MKLFIADDSIILQDRLTEMLSDIENLEIVGTAVNSLDAYKKIELSKPDIIITDIRMPGGGGIELAEYIHHKHPEIVLIVYTNYTYPQYLTKAKAIGVNYFFHKTTQAEELYQTINMLCNKDDFLKKELNTIDEN